MSSLVTLAQRIQRLEQRVPPPALMCAIVLVPAHDELVPAHDGYAYVRYIHLTHEREQHAL